MPIEKMKAAVRRALAAAPVLAVLASPALATGGLPSIEGKIDLDRPVWGESRAGQYLAGMQAQRLNDPAAAARFLEHALGHDPNNIALVRHVFFLMVSEGMLREAEQHARMILHEEPGSFIPAMTLAVSAMKDGHYGRALELFGTLDSGGHDGLMKTLGQAWAAAGAGDLALARAVLNFPPETPGWDSLGPVHRALIEDVAGGEPGPAYEALKAQQADLPRRLSDLIGNFEARQQNPETPAAVKSPPEGLALAFGTIASALVRAEQDRSAMIYTQLGLWLSPSDESLLLLLADNLQSKERYKDAAAVYERVPEGSEFHYPAQIARARNLAAADDMAGGIALLERLTDAFPDEPEAAMQLGDLLRREKKFAEAVTAYNTAFARLEAAGQKPGWQLYYTRGIAYERTGQWPMAEADFKKALEIEADQPLVLNYLGYSWIDRGENLETGAEMVRKAAELRPDDGYIADSVGWAAYRLGDLEEAVRELERAILLEPLDPTINEHLGDIYWLLGRTIEARYQWERAMSFDPEEERVPGLKERLACTDEVCAPLQDESRKRAPQ